MKKYYCHYCKNDIEVRHPFLFASHVKYCNFNPKRSIYIETAKLNLSKIKYQLGQGRAGTVDKEILRRQRISETMKKNPNAGGLREGSGRGKKVWYESPIAGKVYIRSTYELEYVKWLDLNNINWNQNSNKFPYIYMEKRRYYYPDFYLADSDEYIEIKGYKTEKDIAK